MTGESVGTSKGTAMDTVAGYIVTLEENCRDDEAKGTINAIRMVKGVLSVEPIVADFDLHIAEARAVSEWRGKIINLLWPPPAGAEGARWPWSARGEGG